jgi:hypothetical protein
VSLSENVVPIAPSENHSISRAKHVQTKIVGARFFSFLFFTFFFTLCACRAKVEEERKKEKTPGRRRRRT